MKDSDDDAEPATEETEEEESSSGGTGKGFALGLVAGAVLGAAVALLFAPAAGHITRRRLRRRLEDVRDRAESGWEHISRRAKREMAHRAG
jgi:gas vesicle protein